MCPMPVHFITDIPTGLLNQGPEQSMPSVLFTTYMYPTAAQCATSQSTNNCALYSFTTYLPLHSVQHHKVPNTALSICCSVHLHKVLYHCTMYIFTKYPTIVQCTYSKCTPPLHNVHIQKVPHHCTMHIFTK